MSDQEIRRTESDVLAHRATFEVSGSGRYPGLALVEPVWEPTGSRSQSSSIPADRASSAYDSKASLSIAAPRGSIITR